VFVATPYMDEAERCTTVAFMDSGAILFADSPAGLKRRVPGTLFEIESTDERAAQRAVGALPGVTNAALFGDLVRVLVADGGPGELELRRVVHSAGVNVRDVHPGRIDMEATFAYLAEQARAEAPSVEPESVEETGGDA